MIDADHAGEQYEIHLPKPTKLVRKMYHAHLSHNTLSRKPKLPRELNVDIDKAGLSELCSPQFLSFLAVNGKFTVEAPPTCKNAVHNLYEHHTDNTTWDETMFASNTKKWGVNCRIHIHVAAEAIEIFGIAKLVTPTSGDKNLVIINNNDLWWHLIRIGFRLGTGHDIDAIMESLPEDQKDAFIEEYVHPTLAA